MLKPNRQWKPLKPRAQRSLAIVILFVVMFSLSGNLFTHKSYAFLGDCTPSPSWGTLDTAKAAAMWALVNADRSSVGVGALKSSPTLTAAAQYKSLHEANYNYLNHDDPAPPSARTWSDRIGACGYPVGQTTLEENLGYGSPTAQEMFNQWINSTAHKTKIENPFYAATGIGVAQAANGTWYWTEEFGGFVDAGSIDPPTTAPTVSVSKTPNAYTTNTSDSFWWTVANSPTSILCSLDGAAATPCTSPFVYNGLALGTHSWTITVSNSAGSNSFSYSWQVTSTVVLPTVTITSGPGITTTATTASFSFTTAFAPTSVLCSVDGGAFLPCTSPKNYQGFQPVSTHKFTVTASNINGTNSDSYTWTVTPTGGGGPVPGDTNGDGHVTNSDLTTLISNWKTSSSNCDFNADGRVDVLDLSILLSHYGV